MKRILLLVWLLTGYFEVLTQPSPELTIPLTSANVQIVAIESQGFLLMDFSGPRLNEGQLALPIMQFDVNLQQQWKNVLPVTRGLRLQHYQVVGPYFFMAFSDPRDQFLEVYRLDLQQGHFQKSQYQFSNSFKLESIAAKIDRVWVSGSMANQGVLFALDEQNNKYDILPTASSGRVQAIRELDFNVESGQLTFLLLTTSGKQQTYVLRSMQVDKNRVSENLILTPPTGLQLTQARLLSQGDTKYISGTFFKKNPQQAMGVFLYKIRNSTISQKQFKHFKDLPQFSEFTFWGGQDQVPKMQSKKGIPIVFLDNVVVYQNGLLVSLELLEKRFQAKGALQQEIERNQLVNNLDQDQFGRRSLDQSADENQTVEDRMSQRSATDILQYRYRNALVAQPTFEGLGFDRSVVLVFDDNLKLKSCQGVKTGKWDLMYVGIPNTFITPAGVRQFYDRGGSYYTWLYHPQKKSFDSFDQRNYAENSSQIFRLSPEDFIVAEMNKEPAGYLLTLKKWPMAVIDQQ